MIVRWINGLGESWVGLKVRFGQYLLRNVPASKRGSPQSEVAAEISRKLQKPGIDCPSCGTLIPVEISRLLSRSPIVCPNPGCRLSLSVDAQKSEESLEALGRFQEALATFEKNKKIFR